MSLISCLLNRIEEDVGPLRNSRLTMILIFLFLDWKHKTNKAVF